MNQPGSCLIVCVGNSLAGDDRAGCAVYDLLCNEELPQSVTLLRLELAGLALLDHLSGQQLLLVVDAVQLGKPAGTVHVLEWDQIPASPCAVSIHGIGIREALEVCGELFPERLPQRIVLVGIEGRCFNELGAEMTEPVAAGVRRSVREIKSQIMPLGVYEKAI